jgi:phytoene/squalene synthetase
MRNYAAHWLKLTSDYAATLPEAPFSYLIKIPLALAEATLEALAGGHEKLSREQVIALTRA